MLAAVGSFKQTPPYSAEQTPLLSFAARTKGRKKETRGGVVRWWWCFGSGAISVVERRVGESGVDERVDREIRILFGFAGKISPESFSAVVAGGEGWPAGVAAAGVVG
nr:hypothetical protein [Tanacetum cinerariifolium]